MLEFYSRGIHVSAFVSGCEDTGIIDILLLDKMGGIAVL
jgi:hypothetical protein